MNNQLEKSEQTPETTSTSSNARRKLLKGVGAAPVVATLLSRPVLGAQNCSPSGFMSGNLSSPDAFGSCGGLSPGYWKTHLNWPQPFESGVKNAADLPDVNKKWEMSQVINPNATIMATVFTNPEYPGETLWQILWNHPGSLEFHVIAALLNAASDLPDYVLTVDEVIDIYNSYRSLGYYETSNGIKMFADDIRAFIENTYH